MANYTLNFSDAYANCFNVTLINLKANAYCIEYAFSITQITLNISKASYSIHIANSNTRICTQSDSSAYFNSFNIAITQGTLNIGWAANLIHFATFIIQACSHCSFIANYKAFSIYISISCFWTFEDTIAEPRDYCESLCTGTSLYDSTPL